MLLGSTTVGTQCGVAEYMPWLNDTPEGQVRQQNEALGKGLVHYVSEMLITPILGLWLDSLEHPGFCQGDP